MTLDQLDKELDDREERLRRAAPRLLECLKDMLSCCRDDECEDAINADWLIREIEGDA